MVFDPFFSPVPHMGSIARMEPKPTSCCWYMPRPSPPTHRSESFFQIWKAWTPPRTKAHICCLLKSCDFLKIVVGKWISVSQIWCHYHWWSCKDQNFDMQLNSIFSHCPSQNIALLKQFKITIDYTKNHM